MVLIDDVKTYLRGSHIVGSVEEERKVEAAVDRLKVRLDRAGIKVNWNLTVPDAKHYVYTNFSRYMNNLIK